MDLIDDWLPLRAVDVRAEPIAESDRVGVHVILDRVPDSRWTAMFHQALGSLGRRERSATFLGRYICLQPVASELRGELAAVNAAMVQANGRYALEVTVRRHSRAAVAAADAALDEAMRAFARPLDVTRVAALLSEDVAA
jgi:hypothetical protein